MSIQSAPRFLYKFKSFSQVASAIVILLGCLVLVGWMYNISILKSVFPGLVSMKVNTALNFILVGVSLWLSQTKQAHKSWKVRRYIVQACACTVLLVSLLTLTEYLLGWDLGIDQLLFKEPLGTVDTFSPGRMSLNSTLCFILDSLALLLLSGNRRGHRLARRLTLLPTLVALVTLIGYIYNVRAFYGIITYTPMALHAALGFIILSVGILFAGSDRILVETILTATAGGVMARRLLPTAISIPLVLGWLCLKGQKAGLYDAEFSLSLFVVSNIVFFVVLIWCNARLLNEKAALLQNEQQMEQGLRKSEGMLQLVIDLIPESIWWKDRDSRFLGCNRNFAQMTGVGTPKNIISKTDYDVWTKKEADFFRSVDARVMAQNKAEYGIVEAAHHQEGTVTWLETNKIPLHDEEGRVIGTLGTAQDITERIQAELALRQAHDELELRVSERTTELATALRTLQAEITQRQQVQEEQARLVEQLETERGQLEAILNSMTDGLIVGDLAGNVLTMNSAALRLYEYQSVDEARRHPEDSHTFELHYLDGRFMPVEEWPFARALKGETFSNFELQVRRIDTGKSWISTYTGTFVRNKAGESILVIITTRDITERMQTEKALRESFQRYRFLADSMPQIVWTARKDGTLDYYNQTWYDYTGMTFEQTKDRGLIAVLHPNDQQLSVERWTKAVSKGESYEIEYRLKRASDATYRWHLGLALPMRNQNKEIVQWVGTCTDIDDQKQAESALRRAHDELEIRVAERTQELATANQALQAEITERSTAELALQQANEKLKGWVNELEQRNREIALLRKMSDILQACLTVEEAYTAIAKLAQPLFPQTKGGIFLLNGSKNLVEAVATWGSPQLPSQEVFTPDDCWALRRGRVHWVEHAHGGLLCKHLHQNPGSAESLCVPMMAQGEAMGVLYLSSLELGGLTQTKQQLAVTVAEHLALSLANLKLRETLQNQSIRDPLTGLFNRRYLEESLEREVNRAERQHQSLGMIMLDVDHFKRFNDTFGHEAGDALLRELGHFLQSHIRNSDIACRYGGEEITLILPDASLDVTHQRAELIRQGAKHLQVQHRHQPVGAITLSLGVACFPEHGLTGEAVMQAADAALYRAKKEGRDAVRVAP